MLRYFWFRIFEMAIFLLTSSLGDFCGLLLACSEQHRRGQEERAETREALTHLALPDPNPAQNCWLKKVEIKLILGELICWSWDDIFLLINSEIIFVEMTSFWRGLYAWNMEEPELVMKFLTALGPPPFGAEGLLVWFLGGTSEISWAIPFLNFTRGQKRHLNMLWHINYFSVTPVTDLPGGVPGPKCLCSAHST